MGKISTLTSLIRNNPQEIGRAIDGNITKWGIMRYVPDRIYLKMRYGLCIHRKLNLRNPRGFNEKLQWLKLYYRDPDYEMLVDKLAAKDYVSQHYPDLKVIPTIGVWERPEDIDFDTLPNQFVIKCTHDTGSTIICKDRNHFDAETARIRLRHALKRNMYYPGREWVYKNIQPKIIAESFLTDDNSNELMDYKFMCFDGKVRCSFVCSDRFSHEGLHVTFFDKDWNVMPFTRHYPMKKEGVPKPVCYGQMVVLAERMSKGMPFVRIDFYEINHTVYFGEYTFFPGSGLEEFDPEEWDTTIGHWITLPKRCSNR